MNEKNKQKIIDLKSKEEEMDYDVWVEETSKANNKIIDEFEQFLKTEKLSKKTINRHIDNVDTFANYYLTAYSYCGTIFDGYKNFGDFFGYWLITKYLIISKSFITAMITTMKKFYTFLFLKDYIDENSYADAFATLKDGKEEWLEQLEMFENGTYYSQFDD